MKRSLIRLYKRLFVRTALYPVHRRLLNISLWGLGVLNSENDRLSGEDHFLRHLPRWLPPEGRYVVFDVGANVGNYAGKVRRLWPRSAVYAFEPAPASYARLRVQADEHGFRAFNVALSDVAGRLPLYNRAGNRTEHASLFRDVVAGIHEYQDVVQTEVPVSTIDDVASEHQIEHIHLLKVDTEGNDLNVLLGARRMLAAQAIDVIQFEFNSMNVVSHVFLRDFHALLEGFTFYRMLPDGLVRLSPNPTFLSEIFAFQNIVAVRGARLEGS